MPFDNAPDGKLTLEGLAWRLRHPETWPKGFRWDYGACSSCAMGLAYRLAHDGTSPWWRPQSRHTHSRITESVRRLIDDIAAMNDEDFFQIFWNMHSKHFEVTPEHVADAIDAVLAKQKCLTTTAR